MTFKNSKFRLRYIFRPFVRIIAKGLSKIGVTPNGATFIMLAFAVLSFVSLAFYFNLLFFSIFVFSVGLFDGVDGAIARLNNKASARGGFLDSVMDRVSEFFIFLALLLYCWNDLLWNMINMKLIVFISFFASLMISYSRARAEPIYKGNYDVGLMARSERLFYLVITSLIAFFWGFYNELLFVFMWLVVLTAIFRFFRIKKQIEIHETSD